MTPDHAGNPYAMEPADNGEAFSRLSDPVRGGLLDRLRWINKIGSAGSGSKGAVVAQAALALNLSEAQIHRIRRDYKAGGWQALLDNRGRRGSQLPEACADFVRTLHFQHQRSTTGREVHRTLVERWRLWLKTGDAKYAVPGYATPPPAGPKGYPAGWSEDTILRLRPDNYEVTAVRQGAKAAYKFLPSILKTRVGLRFGEVIFCDDQDYDLKIMPRGTGQKPLRPQGFNFLDYLSGAFVHHVIRLRWWDTPADQYRTLTQQDFTWALIAHLQRNGYRRDEAGTTLVMEHGTATGFDNARLETFGGNHSFDDALKAVSGGCISVNRSGLFNKPVFAGMLFRPQSSGNPNFKAPLESMFNLVRNRMAALPGATGRNRDLKPAEQSGLDLYTVQLMKLWERLDERHRAAMIRPVLTPEEFGTAAGAVYDAINARTDHLLEGWEKLGFTAPQLRFTPDERTSWLNRHEVEAMPAHLQAALLAMTETPGHMRPAKLSPADVARQYAGELTKLPDYAIPLLVPTAWARPVTVKDNRTIAIQDQLLGSEAFSFMARFEDRDGWRVLSPGTKVLAYLNPYDCERLIVCREDGGFMGTLWQQGRAGFTDHEAIVAQMKNRAELKADLDTGVRPHMQPLVDERAEMRRVNDRLAKGLPVLPDEVAAARAESAREGVRTRKANEITTALGGDALATALLLDTDDEDELQEPCMAAVSRFSLSELLADDEDERQEPRMAAAGAFSLSQLLTPTTEIEHGY
jgi:hypothetical protein